MSFPIGRVPNAPSKSVELLVFDLDGTLVDSQRDITTAINLTFNFFGVAHVSTELVGKHIGTGVQPLIISALKEAGVFAIDEVLEKFAQCYLEHLTHETAYYAGLEDVLSNYRDVPKAILTNKSNRFVEPLSRKLELNRYFSRVYGRESFATCKPDAGPLRSIAELFNVPIDSVVMIGDTATDIQAGKAAGTLTCAVTYGYGNANDLRSLAPNDIVAHPIELIGLFCGPSRE